MTLDPERDEELARMGPDRTATGSFFKQRPKDGFKRRTVTFEFNWQSGQDTTPITGRAVYRYVDNDSAYLTPVTDFQGTETIANGRFSGGHGGRFEAELTDKEDGSHNNITGVLCADGTGKLARH